MSGIKIKPDDITIGPKEPDELQAAVWAYELDQLGYRRTSNAYCLIGRVDRDDWHKVLAIKMRGCPADFYMTDGSGLSERWKGYYIRQYTTDKHTVAPAILRKLRTAQ